MKLHAFYLYTYTRTETRLYKRTRHFANDTHRPIIYARQPVKFITDCPGQVLGTPLYLEGPPVFEIRPRDKLSRMSFLVLFTASLVS
jgi:hypothetical protein